MTTYSFDDLQGKVCVITGGGGVIGTELAKAIASTGVKVVILDFKQEFVDIVVAENAKVVAETAALDVTA